MVTALILAYDFPPFVSVGGLRPHSWFRHFKEFGVGPVVVTRQWENRYGDERDYIAPSATLCEKVEVNNEGTIIRAPYVPHMGNRLFLKYGPNRLRVVRRAITAWFEVSQFYAPLGPRAALYRAARRALATRKIDVILATGEPFVLFTYATLLSREFGVPWVADFRDPWSQDKLRATNRMLRLWGESLERRATASAAAITTVSENIAEALSSLHATARVEVVRNGFDSMAAYAVQQVSQGVDRLTIAFAGTIYPYHPVESVLQILDQIAGSRLRISMKFIGVNNKEALEALLRARFHRLAETTTLLDRLPNEQALAELAVANALLLFNEYAYPGTKIFDYLAVKRKILLCYSDDPVARHLKEKHYNFDHGKERDDRALERLVQETRSGIVVSDSSHLREVVQELLREFDAHRAIACDSIGIDRYSRRTQAGTMAHVLKSVRGTVVASPPARYSL
ncbi:MAG: glycosyltransferase [Fimbriimonadaceae bacterium]|nr:glycosyltransferase [Fimbriimonadaceae bacterium]